MKATTDPEVLLRRGLKALEKNWPEGYWVFVGAGFNLMRCGEDGQRVYIQTEDEFGVGMSVGVDPDYIVESFNIPSDGGDF